MEEFIRNITDQIRCVRARESVAREISDHIKDQAETYEKAGTEHEEAVRMALREMGDPVQIGVELDRIHRPQMDIRMIMMVFVFSLGGLALQYFGGGYTRVPGINAAPVFAGLFGRQCLVLLLAFAVMVGMYFLDYSFIGRYGIVIYAVMTVLFFAGRIVFTEVNGRIPVMFMLTYLYIPAYAGVLYQQRGRGYAAVIQSIVLQFITVVLVNTFTNLLSGASVIYLIQTVMLLLAIRRDWFAVNKKTAMAAAVFGAVILPLLLLTAYMAVNPGFQTFRFARLHAWLRPEEESAGMGYVYLWMREELSHARMIGSSGSTLCTADNLVDPMFSTGPFILLQIMCNCGILVGVFAVLAIAALIVHMFRIVGQQKNQLGYILSAACFMMFLINCVEGVLINCGLFPSMEVQFPFLSCGTGAMVTYAVFIGLFLSIYRNEKIVTDSVVTGRPYWRLNVKLEKR